MYREITRWGRRYPPLVEDQILFWVQVFTTLGLCGWHLPAQATANADFCPFDRRDEAHLGRHQKLSPLDITSCTCVPVSGPPFAKITPVMLHA
jgi:hypothetical protein